MWYQVHRRLAMVLTCAVGVSLGSPDLVLAQQVSPTPSETTCSIPPRDAAFFETLQGTPVVPDTKREPLISAYQSATESANSEQVTKIQQTIDLLFTCYNEGDLARYSALFSDDYWRRETGNLPLRALDFAALFEVTPSPVSEENMEGPGTVVGPRVLPDGRVAALVQFARPGTEGDQLNLVVFAMTGDRWLIDDVITDVALEFGTPTAGG